MRLNAKPRIRTLLLTAILIIVVSLIWIPFMAKERYYDQSIVLTSQNRTFIMIQMTKQTLRGSIADAVVNSVTWKLNASASMPPSTFERETHVIEVVSNEVSHHKVDFNNRIVMIDPFDDGFVLRAYVDGNQPEKGPEYWLYKNNSLTLLTDERLSQFLAITKGVHSDRLASIGYTCDDGIDSQSARKANGVLTKNLENTNKKLQLQCGNGVVTYKIFDDVQEYVSIIAKTARVP